MWPVGINSKAAVDQAPLLYPFVPPAKQDYAAQGSLWR